MSLFIAPHSGEQTPTSIISHNLETGDHVICNTTVIIGEKDPLGLVEAVGQQLEQHHDSSHNSSHEDLHAPDLNQGEEGPAETAETEAYELQDTSPVQDAYLQDTSPPQDTPLQDTPLQDTTGTLSIESDGLGEHVAVNLDALKL